MEEQEIRSHPLFSSALRDFKYSFVAKLANRFFSLGGVSYYLHDKEFYTKVFLYNYASFFAGKPFGADWSIELYSPNGECVFKKTGSFLKEELVVVDLREENIQSPFGLVVAHIMPREISWVLPKFFDAVFFTEHHRYPGIWHDVAHSLRYPTPFNYRYKKTGHAFSFMAGATPYLIFANSYKKSVPLPRVEECIPFVRLINSKGKEKSFSLPQAIPPLGATRVNILDYIPDAHDFFENEPGLIMVSGNNIIKKPFFYQTKDTYISSDHL